MRIAVGLLAVSLTLAVLGLALPAVAPAPARAAGTGFALDSDHSYVLFRIKHMDVGYNYGRFNGVSGTIQWDDANPAAASVSVEVKTASVDTGSTKRDDHLRSPDFFNAPQFPSIAFKSTAVKAVDATHVDVTGNLTLHGATKPVTVRMEKTGSGKGMDGEARVGFEGTFTIKRSEWGMSGGLPMIGDEVRMTIAVEAAQQ